MLTILDLLNHYLGFFNVNTKWKGQVYTILASVGNFYVLYLAIMHLKNAAYLRGLGLLLAFIVIAYFAFLNVVYYFTKKTFKWDLSPKVEKLLGVSQRMRIRRNVRQHRLYQQMVCMAVNTFCQLVP